MSSTRPRRSVLFVPGGNSRALARSASLACDSVIFDLEDSVAPNAKLQAREAMMRHFAEQTAGAAERVIRINPLDGAWGTDDLKAAATSGADAILVPKVNTARDVQDVDDALDAMGVPPELGIWIMIETPKAVLNIGAFAELGRDAAARLTCLVAGTNDLTLETGVLATADRRYLLAWLMQIVLAARAAGLDALDGVSNDFRDLDAFARECAQGAAMGFHGKTLIHPAQIPAANQAFSPDAAAIAAAMRVVEAFARPENADKGVLALDGRMVERLHLIEAERLLARAGRNSGPEGETN